VVPQPEATHVRFDCADGYWETVLIEELADPRVIFVLRMNVDGRRLHDPRQHPARQRLPARLAR
jgi:DMSO/TMAO reductase YedYZ molybdopterin-dependent catalytic subunit